MTNLIQMKFKQKISIKVISQYINTEPQTTFMKVDTRNLKVQSLSRDQTFLKLMGTMLQSLILFKYTVAIIVGTINSLLIRKPH